MNNQNLTETVETINDPAPPLEKNKRKPAQDKLNIRNRRKNNTPKTIRHGASFQMRGESLNPIMDASSTIIGLIIRLKTLKSMDNVENLRAKLAEEIRSAETELHNIKYDRATILAYRYALCTAVDEAVMGTEWGAESYWASKSLLSQFHNERWGGEKFFTILKRVMSEPNRYLHLMEFMYVLLNIGFEGMYRVRHHGRQHLEQIMEDLAESIKLERGWGDTSYLVEVENIQPKNHYVNIYTLPWVIFASTLLASLVLWIFFTISIDRQTDHIINDIEQKMTTEEALF